MMSYPQAPSVDSWDDMELEMDARNAVAYTRYVDPGDVSARAFFDAARNGDMKGLTEVLSQSGSGGVEIDINGIHQLQQGYDMEQPFWYGTALHAAARWGRLDAAALLLACGADVDADAWGSSDTANPVRDPVYDMPDYDHELLTPLHASLFPLPDGPAAVSVPLVRLLLDSGADANVMCRCYDGRGRLDNACALVLRLGAGGDVDVPLILELLALLEPRMGMGKPLQCPVIEDFAYNAVLTNSVEVLRWGLDRGVLLPDDLLTKGPVGQDVLSYLITETVFKDDALDKLLQLEDFCWAQPCIDANKALIQRLVDSAPEPPNPEQVFKAVWGAANRGDCAMMRFWLDRGFDVNSSLYTTGFSPFLTALLSDRPDPDLIMLLLEHGADVKAPIPRVVPYYAGYTPLLAAFRSGSPDIRVVKTMLEKGADVNARSRYYEIDLGPRRRTHALRGDRTPLHEAARCGSHEAVRLLLDAGADTEARVPDTGETPLLALAYAERLHPELVECARTLADATGEISALDHNGRTVLHLLANRDVMPKRDMDEVIRPMVKILVDKGIDLGVVDKAHQTAAVAFRFWHGVELEDLLR